MPILKAIIMGIVQGLSEFLPVSSSAHLVLTSNLYKIITGSEITEQSSQEVFLDIMLHLGTLIAVLIFFRKEIAQIIKSMFEAVKEKNYSNNDAKIGFYILFGTFITVLIAFPLNEVAKNLVFAPAIVGLLLILTGLLLFFSEWFSKKIINKSNEIDFKTSVFMAIAQGLAALPGFSRSGLTICTGLLAKKDRLSAAKYSFLLSIPIILGASMFYPLLKINSDELIQYDWLSITTGTIVSTIVGYLCVKYFLKFVAKYSLAFFGYYCIIVGVGAFVFFNFIG